MSAAESAEVVLPFTPAEREGFFQAIARHRRAAWRVTIVTALCAVLLAWLVGALLAPLLYGFIVLALDLVNFVYPTPELVGPLLDAVGRLVEHPETVAAEHWLYMALVTALPGLVLMSAVGAGLVRVMRRSATLDVGALPLRAPDRERIEELRLANVVEEMAIAAGIAVPRFRVTTAPGANAAVFGVDETHATVVVSQRLLELLNRQQLQAVVAHLVGAIADGDTRIGLRVAVLLSLFGLLARLSGSIADRNARQLLARLAGAVLWPSASAAERLASECAHPFDNPGAEASGAPPGGGAEGPAAAPAKSSENDWRALAWFPITGSLMFTGFLSGLVSTVVLAPLLALAWRSRKYMADAIAVRLTRDPDALAGALQAMGGGAAFAPWAAHLCVAPSSLGAGGVLGASWVAMFPGLERRLKALGTLGASVTLSRRRMPRSLLLLIVPLSVVVAGLLAATIPLLVFVSIAIAGLFTWLPVALLDQLLRALAG